MQPHHFLLFLCYQNVNQIIQNKNKTKQQQKQIHCINIARLHEIIAFWLTFTDHHGVRHTLSFILASLQGRHFIYPYQPTIFHRNQIKYICLTLLIKHGECPFKIFNQIVKCGSAVFIRISLTYVVTAQL